MQDGNSGNKLIGYVPELLGGIKFCLSFFEGYESLLRQCFVCFGFWVDKENESAERLIMNAEKWQVLTLFSSIKRLNELFPSVLPEVLVECGFPLISHGICKPCFSLSRGGEIIRARQIKEGNFDCFGKGLRYCDQGQCSFYDPCVVKDEEYYRLWLRRVTILKEKGLYPYPNPTSLLR